MSANSDVKQLSPPTTMLPTTLRKGVRAPMTTCSPSVSLSMNESNSPHVSLPLILMISEAELEESNLKPVRAGMMSDALGNDVRRRGLCCGLGGFGERNVGR